MFDRMYICVSVVVVVVMKTKDGDGGNGSEDLSKGTLFIEQNCTQNRERHHTTVESEKKIE